MKRIFSILFAVVLVVSFSLIPAAPAMATGTTTTLSIPDNVYRPAPFDVSGTTTNPGTSYSNVRFNITVSGPVDFTGAREDIFTITYADDPLGIQGFNETFVLVDGDFVGYWGPPGGFPLPASYSATSTFTVQMNDGGTAPVGDYEVTVELVDLTDGTLASATDGFSLSADTLYVGAGQQFTTIQAAVDAASPGDTINVAAGTYNETVTIGKSLTLTGDVGDSAAGPGTNAPILDGNGVVGSAITIAGGVSNVTIEGFEIHNYRNRPAGTGWTTGGIGSTILAWNSTAINNVTVRDNYMHDLGWSAVLVGNEGQALHGNWLVENNVVEDWAAYAIELTNTQNSSVIGNEITGGTNVLGESSDDSQDAILIQAQVHTGSGLTVTTVTVDDNTVNGPLTRAGIEILAWDSTSLLTAELEDITVINNSVDGAARGIFVFSVFTNADISNLEINRNVLDGNSVGIYSYSLVGTITDASIAHNEILSSSGIGIRLLGNVTDISIHHNTVTSSGGDGINVAGDSDSIQRNTVTGNGGVGIKVAGDSDSIHFNTVRDNSGYGIHLTDTSHDNTVHHNTLSGNAAGNFGDIQDDGSNNKVFRNK